MFQTPILVMNKTFLKTVIRNNGIHHYQTVAKTDGTKTASNSALR
jgi:hypothetical protein